MHPDLAAIIDQIEEYLEARMDADCDQDGFIPNEEMKLLIELRAALAKGVA